MEKKVKKTAKKFEKSEISLWSYCTLKKVGRFPSGLMDLIAKIFCLIIAIYVIKKYNINIKVT